MSFGRRGPDALTNMRKMSCWFEGGSLAEDFRLVFPELKTMGPGRV